jgi:hypothetical protein
LGQATVLHGGDDRSADLCDNIFIRQAPSDAQRITSRDQGANGTLGDAKFVTQAPHLEPVGDGETLESKLSAEHVGHDPAADGAWYIVDCGHQDVRAHDRPHA